MSNRTLWTGIVAFIAIVVIAFNIHMVKSLSGSEGITQVDDTKVEIEIRGDSMEPTLHDGDVWLADTSEMTLASLQKGDIVILKDPEPEQGVDTPYIVKRIAGIAGDNIEIEYGKLYVNGYFKNYGTRYPNDFGPYTVKDNSIFLLGDNGPVSKDSRYFREPSVALSQVIGRLIIE